MADAWRMFPVTIDQDQAFISFNDSFARSSDIDLRRYCLRIEVALKNPTEAGLPQADELSVLPKLDDALQQSLAPLGGIYVGRVTVAARRYFLFLSGLNSDDGDRSRRAGGCDFGVFREDYMD